MKNKRGVQLPEKIFSFRGITCQIHARSDLAQEQRQVPRAAEPHKRALQVLHTKQQLRWQAAWNQRCPRRRRLTRLIIGRWRRRRKKFESGGILIASATIFESRHRRCRAESGIELLFAVTVVIAVVAMAHTTTAEVIAAMAAAGHHSRRRSIRWSERIHVQDAICRT